MKVRCLFEGGPLAGREILADLDITPRSVNTIYVIKLPPLPEPYWDDRERWLIPPRSPETVLGTYESTTDDPLNVFEWRGWNDDQS